MPSMPLPLIKTVVHNDHTFVPGLISPGGWAVDCGANKGSFSTWLSVNTQARVIAFEPDPRLFAELPTLPRVAYHNCAVSGTAGEVEIHLGTKLCSSLIFAEPGGQVVKVQAVKLDDFLQAEGVVEVDLLKLDIEGAELDVFESLDARFLNRVKQITCEFHDFLDSSSRPRVEAAIRKLEEQGFYHVNFSRLHHGDVLFINSRFMPLSTAARLNLHSQKYVRGGKRLAERAMAVARQRVYGK